MRFEKQGNGITLHGDEGSVWRLGKPAVMVTMGGRSGGAGDFATLDCSGRFEADPKGTYVKYDLDVRNTGDEAACIDDLSVDFRLEDAAASATATGCFESSDCYLLSGPQGEDGVRLVIAPYYTAQVELCEALGDGFAYRCYLYSKARRGSADYAGYRFATPTRALDLKPGETRTFTFLMAQAVSQEDVAEFLIRFQKTPLGFAAGANGMRMLRHYMVDDPKRVDVSRELANGYQAAVITDGRLSSLTEPHGSIEAIDPKVPFGDIAYSLADGTEYATSGKRGRFDDNGDLKFTDGPIGVGMAFRLQGRTLSYTLRLINPGSKPATLTDLNVKLPFNCEMDWQIDAAQRMIRHTQVAGDNSFTMATPSDGKPPYLMCVPRDGASWEFFDLESKPDSEGDGAGGYRVHLCAQTAAAEASTHEGGRWNLPTGTIDLKARQTRDFTFDFVWEPDYEAARAELVARGKVDIEAVPGYTVPRDQEMLLKLDSIYQHVELTAQYPDQTAIRKVSEQELGVCADGSGRKTYRTIYAVGMAHLGENLLTVHYGDGRVGWLQAFSTLPVGELIEERANYITSLQNHDDSKWYRGLFQERNTRTGVVLNPDQYDQISGWRIYEVTCDDPGLSKPAFLSAKNAVSPDREQVEALDEYLEHFVWGGLQRRDTDDYPYGVYGVPDWKTLRDQRNLTNGEHAHIWRLWDYPHVAQTWFGMYQVAKRHPDWTALNADEYLKRAWGTFIAMYRYPDELDYRYDGELDNRSPYKTGYYNEVIISEVIAALRAEGQMARASQLEEFWNHKADFLIRQGKNLFGSEYAFDTTGFESTQAVVDWGRTHAMSTWNSDRRSVLSYRRRDVERFDDYQRACNIACRGWLENGYFITGSDIRNDVAQYTLSYMSQMGGWSLLEDALYADGSPFALLRLASASLMSSWALENAGDEQSDYGYWFGGKANQGASSGGYEPTPYTTTWLGQPSYRGVWQYGCEIDLGYCGYLRGAAMIVADDPVFGWIVYGGRRDGQDAADGAMHLTPADGVGRRFHIVASESKRLNVTLDGARYTQATVSKDAEGRTHVALEVTDCADGARAHVSTFDGTGITIGGHNGADLNLPVHDGMLKLVVG
ncbi:DUF5695 domain-containing protein [Bifidobacterium sp. ESL0764]|uniref:DUF5695 domain-containing protein n=1 Tax=Bifidobacterium sp. ESL0764 TaxID=2983228 RepID=UPI0023F94822|nr:DUF5695 domain-containing protein [Bifidobacterium sp. ESL0764]WEV65259.1 DUF5695 domain-containing protein [Bifidobacterium sp. ESL0764]